MVFNNNALGISAFQKFCHSVSFWLVFSGWLPDGDGTMVCCCLREECNELRCRHAIVYSSMQPTVWKIEIFGKQQSHLLLIMFI